MPHGVSPKRFHETDWRIIREAACAHFRTESLEAGADLVESIVGLADAADRPLEVDLRAGGVTVRIPSNRGEFIESDLTLAGEVSSAAKELGATVDPERSADGPDRDRRAGDPRGAAILARRARVRADR